MIFINYTKTHFYSIGHNSVILALKNQGVKLWMYLSIVYKKKKEERERERERERCDIIVAKIERIGTWWIFVPFSVLIYLLGLELKSWKLWNLRFFHDDVIFSIPLSSDR